MSPTKNNHTLIRFLARHAAIGIFVSWLVLAGLLFTDAGGLYSTLAASDIGLLALLLLAFGFAITFGSTAMGVAVMQLAEDIPARRPPRWLARFFKGSLQDLFVSACGPGYAKVKVRSADSEPGI